MGMKVQDILDQVGHIGGAVDPFKVAEQLNIQITDCTNLSNIPIDALKHGRVIWIDPSLPRQQRHYEAAMKLASILGERDDPARFAHELLLPEGPFKSALKDLLIHQMGLKLEVKYLSPELAEIFNVPEFAITNRLKSLGLISDDKDDVIYDFQIN